MNFRATHLRHAASTCSAALLMAATVIACAPAPSTPHDGSVAALERSPDSVTASAASEPETDDIEPTVPPTTAVTPTTSAQPTAPEPSVAPPGEPAPPTSTDDTVPAPATPAAQIPQHPEPVETGTELEPVPDLGAVVPAPAAEQSRAAVRSAPLTSPLPEANVPNSSAVLPFAAAQSAEQVVLDAGHVDLIEVTVADGALVVHVKDDTAPGGPAFRKPTDVQARVKDAAKIQVPSDPAFAFLGAAGSDLWMLPQVQDPALLWPGWSTERMGTGQVRGDNVTLRLATADGPGSFALFTTNQFGVPTVIFDNDGTAPNSTVIPINTHAHSSWAFGAPGVYRLTFEVSATLQDGTAVSTPVTYMYLVGDATAPVPWDVTADAATTVPPSGSGPAATTGATSAGGGTATGSNSAGATSSAAAASASATSGAQGALARTGSSPLILLLVGSVLVAAGAVARRLSMRLRP